jgi:phospholipid transport system substrate-binding protein
MKISLETRLALHLLIVIAMLLYMPVAWTQKPDTTDHPTKTIKSLHSSLLEAMQGGEKLGFQGRYKLLTPIIENSHDLDFIAKTILGREWTKLSGEQKEILISHFHKLSISTYSGWFKEYNGEQFKYIEQKEMPRDYVLVRSQLIRSNGDTVSFDYLLRQEKKDWKIINILADGVSDLALRRVEYRSILKQKGFKVFIDMLKKKIELAKKD